MGLHEENTAGIGASMAHVRETLWSEASSDLIKSKGLLYRQCTRPRESKSLFATYGQSAYDVNLCGNGKCYPLSMDNETLAAIVV